MPFGLGISGNPSGKSKIQAEFEKKCREFMEKEGWEGLLKMARDSDKRIRQWALVAIMDRGFGRPKESVDVASKLELAFSPDELAASITRLVSGEAAGGDIAGDSSGATA